MWLTKLVNPAIVPQNNPGAISARLGAAKTGLRSNWFSAKATEITPTSTVT